MTQYLNPDQRTLLVKFLAYLGLVRWYNLFLIALAQYLAAFFVLRRDLNRVDKLLDPGLHFLVLAFGLIIAGGYLINAFYDMEKDLANQPEKLIVGRIISKTFALNTYLLFNLAGVSICFFLGWQVLAFAFFFTFLVWFYSHKLKKITFAGNITATFLSVCSFFVVSVYYQDMTWTMVLYVAFLLIVELIRQIIKDMEAIKGDIVFGYKTVPIALGLKKTKKLLYGLMLLTVFPIIGVYLLKGWSATMLFFLGALLLLAIDGLLIYSARERRDFSAANNLLKVIIVLGVFSLALVF